MRARGLAIRLPLLAGVRCPRVFPDPALMSDTRNASPVMPKSLPPRLQAAFLDRIASLAHCPRMMLDDVAAHAVRAGIPLADALVTFGHVTEQVSYETLAAVSG